MYGLCYMDGLVSTGNKFPYTILKINFAIRKNISNFFINILKYFMGINTISSSFI